MIDRTRPWNRPRAWLLAAIAAVGVGGCSGEESPPKPRSPSLLLVTLDTLRPDYMGVHGYPLPTTPYLDRLFAEGTVFERAVTPIARTTPALAALLTGSYPHRNGVRRLTDPLSDDVVSLAEVLRDRGYQTLAVVSNEVLTPERHLRRGFDVYDFRGSLRTAAGTTDATLAYLDTVDPTRPLFAWVHYVDPHVPYHAPAAIAEGFDPEYTGRYRDHFGSQPYPEAPAVPYRTFPVDLPKPIASHRNPLTDRENEHIRRLYAADIRATDDQLERLVEGFRSRHPDSVTLVTSDHGESLGEHDFYFDHGDYVYDASLRIPLAVILPASDPRSSPSRCEAWVSLVDVAPTLIELLGFDPVEALGEQLEGRSLVSCLGGGVLAERPVFAESGFAYYFDLVRGRVRNDVAGRFRSVTRGDWKLIWTPFQSPAREWQLFNLADDPSEIRDRYSPKHPEFAALRAELDTWMARSGPTPLPRPLSDDDRARLRTLGYLD